jgi:isoleucyl-tRNA synthetase
LIAPFVPFLAEAFWQNLAREPFGERAAESVHLCDYPTGDAAAIDENLSQRMSLMREIASLGRSARMGANLKVRQPLGKVEVILADDAHRDWLRDHDDLIREELNVKQVEFAEQAERYITYTVLPDFKRLGPRVGKLMPAVKKALAQADGGKLLAELRDQGQVTLDLPEGQVELDGDDVQVRLQAKEGWAAAQGPLCVVVLATELTEELIQEGLAREAVRAIQERRKELGCEYTDRIAVGLVTESADLRAAIEAFADYIQGETLAVELKYEPIAGAEAVEAKAGDDAVTVYVQVVK